MRSRWPTRIALVAVVAVLMGQGDSGCASGTGGGESAEERRQNRAEERRQEHAINARVCADNFEALQSELEELNSRLTVGLNFDEYTNKLGDVRVEYDQVDFAAGGDLRCLRQVGVKLEKAMNQYVQAAKTWNECITDYACDNESIQPELQSKWARAGRLIAQAAAAGP
jgi:hypothetical protein